MATTLLVPTIHMNGTSGKELIKQYEAVSGAIDAAQRALSEAWPNGRDFYPQGSSALTAAVSAFAEYNKILEQFGEDFFEVIEALYEQQEQRGGK